MAVQPQSTEGISVDPALQLVIAAENALALTWQRLNTLRRQAFYSGRYDSAEYDKAVVEYRAAERTLREARSSWQRRPQPLSADIAAIADTGDEPYQPRAA